jgi:hypothetical protein
MPRAATAAIILLAQIMADDVDFEGISSPMPMPDQVGPQPYDP